MHARGLSRTSNNAEGRQGVVSCHLYTRDRRMPPLLGEHPPQLIQMGQVQGLPQGVQEASQTPDEVLSQSTANRKKAKTEGNIQPQLSQSVSELSAAGE